MQVTYDDVLAVGKQLGYAKQDVDNTIERAGSLATAHRRLTSKLASEQRFVEQQAAKRFADEQARRAEARLARRAAEERQKVLADRETASLPRRLAACFEAAVLLPCADGVGVAGGGVSSGKKESHAPTGSVNEAVEYHIVRLRALITSFERELDAWKRGAVPETTEERDRRIVRDYEGWPSYDVASFDRSVGSPDTVERARRKHGRTGARGYRIREDDAAAA